MDTIQDKAAKPGRYDMMHLWFCNKARHFPPSYTSKEVECPARRKGTVGRAGKRTEENSHVGSKKGKSTVGVVASRFASSMTLRSLKNELTIFHLDNTKSYPPSSP